MHCTKVYLFLVLIIASCTRSPNDDPGNFDCNLVGEWDCVSGYTDSNDNIVTSFGIQYITNGVIDSMTFEVIDFSSGIHLENILALVKANNLEKLVFCGTEVLDIEQDGDRFHNGFGAENYSIEEECTEIEYEINDGTGNIKIQHRIELVDNNAMLFEAFNSPGISQLLVRF